MSDVTVTFGAKDTGLAAALRQADKGVKGLANSAKGLLGPLAAAGAAFLGARSAAAAFTGALEMGGRLNDLSKRTGIAAGELAVLERAFQNAGAEAGDVGPMVNRLQKALVAGGEEGSKTADIFKALGLNIEEIRKKSPDEQFREVAQAIGDIQDPALASSASMALFGRSGGALLPLFRTMNAEVATARSQLGDLPSVVDKSAETLDSLGDNLTAIQSKGMETAFGLLSTLAPAIDEVAGKLSQANAAAFGEQIGEELGKAIQGFSAWFSNPGESIQALGKTVAGVLLNAGNNLASAFRYAGDWLANFFAALGGDTFPALGNVLQGALGSAATAFNRILVSAGLDFLTTMSQIPGLADAANEGIQSLIQTQASLIRDQIAYNAQVADGTGKIADAFDHANEKTQFIVKDIFGAGDMLIQASDHAEKALASAAGELATSAGLLEGATSGTLLLGNETPMTEDERRRQRNLREGRGVNGEALGRALQGQTEPSASTSGGTIGETPRPDGMVARRERSNVSRGPAYETDLTTPRIPLRPNIFSGKESPAEKMARERNERESKAREEQTKRAQKEADKKDSSRQGKNAPENQLVSLVQSIQQLMTSLEAKLPTPALAP